MIAFVAGAALLQMAPELPAVAWALPAPLLLWFLYRFPCLRWLWLCTLGSCWALLFAHRVLSWELPAELEATLEEIRLAVSGLTPDSDLYQSLSSSLLRLNKSLGNLEALTRTLASQPNAAVMPSSAKPDPVPEVSQ